MTKQFCNASVSIVQQRLCSVRKIEAGGRELQQTYYRLVPEATHIALVIWGVRPYEALFRLPLRFCVIRQI